MKGKYYYCLLIMTLLVAGCRQTSDDNGLGQSSQSDSSIKTSQRSSSGTGDHAQTSSQSTVGDEPSTSVSTYDTFSENPPTQLELSEVDKKINQLAAYVAANQEKGELSLQDQESLLILVKDLYYSGYMDQAQQDTVDQLVSQLPSELQGSIRAIKESAN